MAKLTEVQKKAVPASQRGIPSKSGTGSYPMPDKQHAKAAIMLSGKAPVNKRAAIISKAKRVLGMQGAISKSGADRGQNR